jgi:hypothetical protein
MYQYDGILVDEELIKQNFACDLAACKGACCTFPGDFGAPLLDEELDKIRKNYNEIKSYLPQKAIEIIEEEGFFQGNKGNYTTMCINRRDCVFVYYEGKIAKCGIEKAYFDGKSDFRKPLSCHLFPVRTGNFGGKYIYYEKINECNPALIKGENENMPLLDYLKDAFIRAYGTEWYEKFIEFSNNLKLKKQANNG